MWNKVVWFDGYRWLGIPSILRGVVQVEKVR